MEKIGRKNDDFETKEHLFYEDCEIFYLWVLIHSIKIKSARFDKIAR